MWILEKLGGRARRLTDDPSQETRPAVSPDGRTIVFGAVPPGAGGAIWRIDADGSNRRQISPGPSGLGSGLHEGRTLGPLYRWERGLSPAHFT